MYRKAMYAAFFGVTMMGSAAMAAGCGDVVNDLVAHINQSVHGTEYYVNAKLASNRSDGRYVSFASGDLKKTQVVVGRLPNGIPLLGTGLTTDARQYFSDRLHDSYQPFSPEAVDVLGVTLSSAGTLTLVLKSWGNGAATMPATCAGGLVIADQGGTHYVISFEKGTRAIIY